MRHRPVKYPVIPPAQHHIVDLEPIGVHVSNTSLIAWLIERTKSVPVTVTSGLVVYAIYQGLIDRIKRGDFDG